MAVFEEEVTKILLKFLDRKAKEAEEEIMTKGILSEDKAIPLILKVQFNHIAHLDAEITELRKLVNKQFEKIDERFEKIEKRFEKIEKRVITWLGIGFSFLAILITLFGFLK